MLPAPCYVISDVHLGVADAATEARLLAFLRWARRDAGSLLVNGDLYDFWFEWRHVLPRTGFRILAELADWRARALPVLWIAGNHDCWGGDLLRRDVGVDYRMSGWTGALGGWPAAVEHGDGLRPLEDRGYRALRRVLRHPLAIRAFRWVHPDLATRLALGSSHASRVTRARDGGRGLLRVGLDALARDPGTRLLVHGHSHVPMVERASTGAVYANAGTWLGDATYLRVTPEAVELRRFRESSQGPASDLLRREPALA